MSGLGFRIEHVGTGTGMGKQTRIQDSLLKYGEADEDGRLDTLLATHNKLASLCTDLVPALFLARRLCAMPPHKTSVIRISRTR